MLTELTAPALDAEAAMELAGRLRLPDDPTQDPGLARALDQALALALRHVELAAGRALPQRGFRLAAPGWSEGLVLTVAPVAALDRIALVDAEGAETLCALADFRVDDFRAWPTVVPRRAFRRRWFPRAARRRRFSGRLRAGLERHSRRAARGADRAGGASVPARRRRECRRARIVP
jgi:hypothetical protein